MDTAVEAMDLAPTTIADNIQAAPAGGPRAHSSVRHVIANITVALLFFGALLPSVRAMFVRNAHLDYSPANIVWIMGAILMGVLSLVRVPPGSSMVTIRSVAATVGMMTAPVLIRPGTPSVGLLANLAVGIEFVGITFSQVSRLYLGRRFGLLPANRGIVGTGPFGIVRHPVYAGWFMLTVGYVMAFPNLPNVLFMLLALLFMMWRIALEEELLMQDPAYREYCKRTRYRLIPSVI